MLLHSHPHLPLPMREAQKLLLGEAAFLITERGRRVAEKGFFILCRSLMNLLTHLKNK